MKPRFFIKDTTLTVDKLIIMTLYRSCGMILLEYRFYRCDNFDNNLLEKIKLDLDSMDLWEVCISEESIKLG